MRRALVAAVAFGSAVLGTPAAHASTSNVLHGNCFFESSSAADSAGNDNVGALGNLSFTTTGDSPPALIGATVTCWIDVNGVPAPGTSHSYGDGMPVQAGADPIAFEAARDDFVNVCESVAFADGTTDELCEADAPIGFPPQEVVDVITAVVDYVDGTVCCHDPEPVSCPVLSVLAGNYGPISIEPEGDIDISDPLGLGLNPVWDCPPYETH